MSVNHLTDLYLNSRLSRHRSRLCRQHFQMINGFIDLAGAAEPMIRTREYIEWTTNIEYLNLRKGDKPDGFCLPERILHRCSWGCRGHNWINRSLTLSHQFSGISIKERLRRRRAKCSGISEGGLLYNVSST